MNRSPVHRTSRPRFADSRYRSATPIAVAVAVAAAVAMAVAAAGPPPASAGTVTTRSAATPGDTSPPQLRDLRFSRSAAQVRGLAVVPVTVSVRLTDVSGISEIPSAMTPSPHLTLGPVPGWRQEVRPVLTRTSGTARDGVWSATVQVPSTWHGTVRVTSVGAEDEAGNVLADALTPARSPALRVTGTHRPALTFHYALLPGGGFRIHGRAYYTDTGRPLRRTPLATAYESGCDLDGGARNTIVTDARGRYQQLFPAGEPGGWACVALVRDAPAPQRPTVLDYHVGSAPRPAIPDAALLQPADLGGATPQPFADGDRSALLPPQPCTGATYPSAALRRAGRSVSALVGVDGRANSVLEHVATYRSDGARRYLRELRRGLAACTGPDHQEARWTVLATGVAGDESLLLERRVHLDYAESYHHSYVVVARVGRVLVVVADVGWETTGGNRAFARRLGTRAVQRAAVLNRD
ncbi:hypothetical protein [Jidongwangia harbinensis]|uniref:hypothetical protein n=1 Tax=Jidongwangia harbinensis TaxID=2878561 RepID=UPI001CD924AE|nr:hypothetical protein [Jidongwangia harbinensis]MCA2216572.1 hypothetical protein [Jidongwangia harbinensis]